MLTRAAAGLLTAATTPPPAGHQLPAQVHPHGHLTDEAGRAAALADLDAYERAHALPHPLEVAPVPVMDRLDVHFETPAQLAAWAADLGKPVEHHGPVDEVHALLGGHHLSMWSPAEVTR